MNFWRNVLFTVLVSTTSISCVRSCGNQRGAMSPEKVVEAYLDTAFNMQRVSDREFLLQYTTGRMRDAIASATDETIERAYIKRHYEVQSYSVIERRDRTPRETEITFRLRYKDLGTGDKRPVSTAEAPQVQTENTVALIRERGAWFIRDVIGAKTSIDFPVTAESQITAKPGVISDPQLDEAPRDDAANSNSAQPSDANAVPPVKTDESQK